MKFRYARHTNDLAPLIQFYTEIIGLEVLGNFKDHEGYDGVFLGFKNKDWHLEFTTSGKSANHHFDEDDLLVFYVDNNNDELSDILGRAQKINCITTPENPYWQKNGHCLVDPDGFRIIVSTSHFD